MVDRLALRVEDAVLKVMNTRAFMVRSLILECGNPMAAGRVGGKLYALFTVIGASLRRRGVIRRPSEGSHGAGIAIAFFVALFAFGGKYFGWDDPDGKVRLALAACFILGVIGGYRARG